MGRLFGFTVASLTRMRRASRLAVVPVLALVLWAGVVAEDASAETETFTTPGAHSFTVPAEVTSIRVTAIGAAGAGCYGSSGGRGASVSATVPVTPGTTLYVGVGGVGTITDGGGGGGGFCAESGGAGGFGGGGHGGAGLLSDGATGGGGGGGASVVGPGSGQPVFGSLLVVAGGGGGGAYQRNGGDAGSAGATGNSPAFGGGAGTQVGGGIGGAPEGGGNAAAGATGGPLAGAAGGAGDTTSGHGSGGGGGGGGYYGGGGGGGAIFLHSGAGGGGSSYVTPNATSVIAPSPIGSAAEVRISWVNPTAAISSPSTGGLYYFGQSVPTNFSCTEVSGPGLVSCNDSTGTTTISGGTGHLDTSSIGPHTYSVTATSGTGLTGTTSITYNVVGVPTASIASPDPGGTYQLGQSVPTSFSCAEGLQGLGLASCDDSNGTGTTSGGGGHLDTSTLGSHVYRLTAVSLDGLSTEASISYTVVAPSPTAAPIPVTSTQAGKVCKVPKLTGTSLKTAKRKLLAADCKLGKVSKKARVNAKAGRVRKQGAKPGKLLGAGTKVNLTLG